MLVFPSYYHLTHHIVPGPQSFSYFIPIILLPIALLTSRKTLSRWQSISIFIPVVILATVHACLAMGCVDVISVDVLLWTFYLIVLNDPWKDFRYVPPAATSKHVQATFISSKEHGNGNISSPKITGDLAATSQRVIQPNGQQDADSTNYPFTIRQRLPWVGRLLISIRLNNWKINVVSHDRNQPPAAAFATRTAFLLRTLFSFFCGLSTLVITSVYISYDPYFTNQTISISSPLSPSLDASFIPPRLFRSAIIGAQAWALISQMFYLPCLIPVGLNALGLLDDEWSPHNWAPYFGPIQVVFLHGVRGFWGQYWHQTMRHLCSAPGYALANVLRLRRGSLARYTMINIVTFGLSGIVHMGLVPPEPLRATKETNTIRLYIAGFFWIQPIAMLMEVLAIRLLKLVVGLSSERILKLRVAANAVWVTGWFTVCLPLLGEAGRQLGYWDLLHV